MKTDGPNPDAGRKPQLFLGHSHETGKPVYFSGEGSLLTVGPPGTGKSRGVAVWNLLHYPGSMLVTNPKGQLAAWSAQHWAQALGQEIAVLDLFGLTGTPSASVNPLAGLVRAVASGQAFRTEAEHLTHLLLPDLPGAYDPFWRVGARDLLITGLLSLVAFRPQEYDLPGLHDVLWTAEKDFYNGVIAPMQEKGWAFKQYADDMDDTITKQERNFGYFREEARQALSIFALDKPCGHVCKHSDIDLSRLITGRMTVYLILSPELVASHGRWMGLVTSHAIHSIMRAKENGECVFLLDEFSNLGRLIGIRDDIAQLREKGLRV
jgi:type IV secretion system protein VirD4